jgi:hypothetical protein
MLAFDDVLLIFGATFIANLAVEFGAEIVAEWWVHTPGVDPAEIDPSAASEPVRYAPELLTQVSAEADQTAVWSERTADSLGALLGERLSAKFDQLAMWSGQTADSLGNQVSERLSAKFDQVAVWSEQTALGTQVSERLSMKFDQAAVWSGQVMDKLSVEADALSVKATETALWSEQMIGTLTTGLGLQ